MILCSTVQTFRFRGRCQKKQNLLPRTREVLAHLADLRGAGRGVHAQDGIAGFIVHFGLHPHRGDGTQIQSLEGQFDFRSKDHSLPYHSMATISTADRTPESTGSWGLVYVNLPRTCPVTVTVTIVAGQRLRVMF